MRLQPPSARAAGSTASFGVLAWIVGLVFFFPVFWMVLSAFKEETDANTAPKLFFDPTLDRFDEVTGSTSGLLSFGEAFANSAVDRARLDG